MKRVVVILPLVLIVLLVWFKLVRQNSNKAPQAAESISPPVAQIPKTSGSVSPSMSSNDLQVELPLKTNSLEAVFNATIATNLSQWKQAVKDFKQLGGFTYEQHWIMEKHKPDGSPDRNVGMQVMLSNDGRTIAYDATFISVVTKKQTDNILEAELQTPNMNIDETREFGLQLCKTFGWDSADFLAWCDKTGNHWLDAPLYGTGDHKSNFNIRNTFNDEKPWSIDFVINNP